jgi:2-phosphosulfolactate phosphatase
LVSARKFPTTPQVNIEVVWTPQQFEKIRVKVGEKTVAVVIDVLRATTCMSCALHSGAEKIIAVASHEQARQLKRLNPDAILCGEKNHARPEDFDMGNSPGEFTPQRVKGRVLIHSSSNGTKAVVAMKEVGVNKIYTGCFRQLKILTAAIRREMESAADMRLILAAAGTLDGASYEDLLFASALLHGLMISHPLVSLWRAVDNEKLLDHLAASRNGRALMRKGLGADILAASQTDASPVLSVVSDEGFVVAIDKF